MRLVWHIVRKDFRLLWLPLALWLALLLAQTLLPFGNLGSGLVIPRSYDGLSYFISTWGVIVRIVGFILAAWLVMEDSQVSTRAHWRTRPIHGARLLAAKLLGALLMFSVLPVIVLTPLWLFCGFSAGEWTWAAVDWMLQQAGFSVAAMVLASITATSGQFLLRALGAAILLPVFANYVIGPLVRSNSETDLGVLETRFWLVFGLCALTPLVMLGHQFLTRRTLRSVGILGVGLLLMFAIKFAWTWDASAWMPGSGAERRARAASSAVIFKPDERVTGADTGRPDPSIIRWSGAMTGAPAGEYLRLNSARGLALKPDKSTATFRFKVTDGRPPAPPAAVVRAAAGLSTLPDAPVSWAIEARQTKTGELFQVELNASLMRGRVLGKLPLRVGAELRNGASLTRITGIERVDGHVVVQLEERDAWPSLRVGMYSNSNLPSLRNTRPATDGFIVLNRSQAFEQLPAVTDIGTIEANSIMVGRRELKIAPPTRDVNGREVEAPDWEEGAVIAKVRFAPDRAIARILSIPPDRIPPAAP